MNLKLSPFFIFSFLFITYLDAFDGDVNDVFLPNGMKVIMMEKKFKPYVAVGVFYNVGSHDELPDQKGINRLLGLVMESGTKKYPEKKAQEIYKKYNLSYTYYDTQDITVSISEHKKNEIEIGLDFQSDRMHNQIINEVSLIKAKKYHKTAIDEFKNNQFDRFADDASANMFPQDHPYQKTPIGVWKNIDTLSVSTVQKFYKQYYAPNNAVLVIVGDINPKDIIPLVYKYFGAIEPSDNIPADPDLKVNFKKSNKIPKYFSQVDEIKIFNGNLCLMWFKLPSARNDDIFITQAISEILYLDKFQAGPHIKRFTKNRWLSAGFETEHDSRLGQSFFLCVSYNLFKNVSPYKIKQSVLKTFEDIANKGFDQDLINQYKKKKLLDLYELNNNLINIANNLGNAELIFGDYNNYKNIIDRTKNLNNKDIKRVLKTYFNENNVYVAEVRINKPRWYTKLFIGPIFNILLKFYPGVDPYQSNA